MSEIVVVAYRPKPGMADTLLALTERHVPLLRRLGLASDRAPIVMRAGDGTIVEVFEWLSGGIEAAHQHREVQNLWAEYARVCDYVPLNTLPEARELFAGFEPVSINIDQ